MRTRITWITRRAVAVLCGLMLPASLAWAHLMPAQQGTLNVLGTSVFVAVSLPVSIFVGLDENRDGRVSNAELLRHTVYAQDFIRQHWRLSADGETGSVSMISLSPEADERDSTSAAGGSHLLALMKTDFTRSPNVLRLQTDLFGVSPAEQQLTIKALRGDKSEAVVLSPSRSVHTFFLSPVQVLAGFVRVGITHIWGGADHLLFLLAILFSVVGWRHWLVVLSLFTVAHSISLTLALYGVVELSPTLVEPLIAASIVGMAVMNLATRESSLRHRSFIVFACGLLHGLGFASSISDMGLHPANALMSIVGFNIGIEIGQASFVLLVLLVAGAVAFVSERWHAGRVKANGANQRSLVLRYGTPLNWGTAFVGTLWFVQRVWPAT